MAPQVGEQRPVSRERPVPQAPGTGSVQPRRGELRGQEQGWGLGGPGRLSAAPSKAQGRAGELLQ